MTSAITNETAGPRNAFLTLLTILKGMASRPSGAVGLVLVGFHIVLAIVSPAIVPHDFKKMTVQKILKAPSAEHWFGTDVLGRDVLTRTMVH